MEKPFFPSLLAYMMSGPVTCMVWEGTNAVKVGRMMLGETNPQARSTHYLWLHLVWLYLPWRSHAQLAAQSPSMSHSYVPMTGPLSRALTEDTHPKQSPVTTPYHFAWQASLPGSIRGDFSIEVGRNICHGSDSVENAEKEIKLWFKDGEVIDWTSHSKDWVHEER